MATHIARRAVSALARGAPAPLHACAATRTAAVGGVAKASTFVSGPPDIPLPTTVVVDLGAIENNVRAIRKLVGPDVIVAPALKSNAYGHGAVDVGRACVTAGADWIAVASLAEGVALRHSGIQVPMLCMGYIPPSLIGAAIKHRIKATVVDADTIAAYAATARDMGSDLEVHLKLDTGMGRFGAPLDEAVELGRNIATAGGSDGAGGLKLEGVYTHFSVADDDELLPFTRQQAARLDDTVASLCNAGVEVPMVHCANSAACMRGPEFHRDMVRMGISVYGLQPGAGGSALKEGMFRPALSWVTEVAQVKTLPAGHTIGYGNTYTTPKPTRVALVPTGYGDGYRRGPENYGYVLIGGARCPILGRVSMEKTMVGLWPAEEAGGAPVKVGDQVVLIGKQGEEELSADEVAYRAGTNNYEVATSTLPQARRTFVHTASDGRVSRPYPPVDG